MPAFPATTVRCAFLTLAVFLLAIFVVLPSLALQQGPAPPPAAWKISGILIDDTSGAPVARGRIQISPVGGRQDLRIQDARTMVAGDDGRFLFENVAAGRYSLSAEHRGYVNQSYEQHDQYSTSIVTGPGLETGEIVFRIRPGAAITGKVSDEYGEPVRDARVMLFQAGLQAGRRSTFQRGTANTNDLGMYHFNHLPAGRYFIAVVAAPWYARHAFSDESGAAGAEEQGVSINNRSALPETGLALDVAYPITFYPSATNSDGAAPVKLSAGDRFVADVSMHSVAALHLRVPVSGVENEDSSSVTVHQVLFDSVPVPVHTEVRKVGVGSVAIGGVPPGQYIIDVNTWNESRPSSSVTLAIEAHGDGQSVSGGDHALVHVSGVVKMENPATGIPRGSVQLQSRKAASSYAAQVSTKGEFEFRQPVPAGDYGLTFFGGRGFNVKQVTANVKVKGETVQISGKAPVKLTVELTDALGRIDGVAMHGGRPLAAAMVVLVPEDPANNPGKFHRDQTDSDGTFTLTSILPGQYTVLAIANGWELEWANPEALKPFLAKGEAVQVEARGKYTIRLEAQ
ncbi:MAG TPA: carboxypeptidase regulatory-like domain-containing protein [Candidatus Saccharimonadales bacterium]|jgi:hypothetical protein|nr:carboxypeptidase regulatory-like domain-containing protein [Candidatus Saccharimonadales bacterium]